MTVPPLDLTSITEKTRALNMLRDAVIGHDTRLQGLRDDMIETRADVNTLKAAVLTGDGNNLSHAERIRNLETYADSMKDTIKYWGRLIGGALMLNFLGFMTGIMVAVIKFLPVLERLASQP